MGDGLGHGLLNSDLQPPWESIFEHGGHDLPIPMAALWLRFLSDYSYSRRYRWGTGFDSLLPPVYRRMRQNLSALRRLGLRSLPTPEEYYRDMLFGIIGKYKEGDDRKRAANVFLDMFGEWVNKEQIMEDLGL